MANNSTNAGIGMKIIRAVIVIGCMAAGIAGGLCYAAPEYELLAAVVLMFIGLIAGAAACDIICGAQK